MAIPFGYISPDDKDTDSTNDVCYYDLDYEISNFDTNDFARMIDSKGLYRVCFLIQYKFNDGIWYTYSDACSYLSNPIHLYSIHFKMDAGVLYQIDNKVFNENDENVSFFAKCFV